MPWSNAYSDSSTEQLIVQRMSNAAEKLSKVKVQKIPIMMTNDSVPGDLAQHSRKFLGKLRKYSYLFTTS